jgi:tripartite-type tricarboxylate transporter receptor subunit TctC
MRLTPFPALVTALLASGLGLSMTSAAIAPALAQDAATFYDGKTIDLVVGAPAGSGIDLLARVVAAHLEGHIPGKPRILVRNMPGGGGVRMATHIYSAARRDGTEIGNTEGGMVLNPLFGINPGGLDMTRFAWIGSTSKETGIAVVWAASGVKSIDDARRREVIVGSTGASGTSGQWGALANATLGTRFKTVFGYPGANDMNLAMERGEVESRLATYSSMQAQKPEWFSERKINVVLQLGPVIGAELARVPRWEELVKTDDDRAMVQLIASTFELNRLYMAPPGTPPDRLQVLRTAFDATARNPAFIAAASKYANVAPSSAAEVEAAVKAVYATPQRVVDRLLALNRSQQDLERLQKAEKAKKESR